MGDWIVMCAVDVMTNNSVAFTENAVGLTEEEAVEESARRNSVEKAAGHKGVDWFPCQNPLAVLRNLGI